MPITTTNNSAVQQMNEELQYLERLRKEIEAQLPPEDNFLTRILVKEIRKKLAKIDQKIVKVQKELEEKARASDLVEQDVLDQLSQAAKNAANGKTDEALDNLEEAGKEAASDKVKDIIDDKVKDEDVAERLKDVVDEVKEGDLDGVVDVVKDGVKEEVGDLIDKHVKDEQVAALIKEVVEGVVEGEFENLLEVVTDGVVDIIEDKLIDFVQHLLKLIEERIYEKIEERLKSEVADLIDQAVDLAIETTGAEWTAKLVATVVKRILRRSVVIVKEEVKYLTSDDTLKKLLGVLKDAAIKTLQSGLKGRKIKNILAELLDHAENHSEFQKIIVGLKKRLAEKFLAMAVEEVKGLATEAIDAFLRVHGNWRGSILSIPRKDVTFPLFTGVSASVGASASLSGTLTSRRQGIGAIAHGQVSGSGFVGVGVTIGYDIPIVGDVSITGGIEGGPDLSASLDVELELKNSVIHASIAPFSINAALSGRFFLETPIPNKILKYIPAYVKEAVVIKQNVYYPLGKTDLLIIKTPKYSMTFNMKEAQYVYEGSTGEYTYYLDPRIKALIKSIVDGIKEAANEALEYLDPTNIDLNPFDSEGWIGRHFD